MSTIERDEFLQYQQQCRNDTAVLHKKIEKVDDVAKEALSKTERNEKDINGFTAIYREDKQDMNEKLEQHTQRVEKMISGQNWKLLVLVATAIIGLIIKELFS